MIGVQGAEEVLRLVLAAYRTFAAGRNWDPSAGATRLDGPTVDACARLGGLIYQAGASDFEHGIQPGPVFHFDEGAIGLDLLCPRFRSPESGAESSAETSGNVASAVGRLQAQQSRRRRRSGDDAEATLSGHGELLVLESRDRRRRLARARSILA
jgi:hypothetical protein